MCAWKSGWTGERGKGERGLHRRVGMVGFYMLKVWSVFCEREYLKTEKKSFTNTHKQTSYVSFLNWLLGWTYLSFVFICSIILCVCVCVSLSVYVWMYLCLSKYPDIVCISDSPPLAAQVNLHTNPSRCYGCLDTLFLSCFVYLSFHLSNTMYSTPFIYLFYFIIFQFIYLTYEIIY